MRKILFRVSGVIVFLVVGFSLYYTYAQATHGRAIARALSQCSARTAIVLSRTNHDIDSLTKAIRNINEAITYVDGVVQDVHVHEDGSVHFDDEQPFEYMKLCGDTLRSEGAFLEAVAEFGSQSERLAAQEMRKDARADELRVAEERREQAYDEFLSRHKLLREALTEMRNKNVEIISDFTPEALVDIGAIEHAQREMDFLMSRTTPP